MRRELGAGIVLAALILGSALSVQKTDELCYELLAYTEEAYQCSQNLAYERAEAALREGLSLWLQSDGYTHIFIRHSEVDSTADAFFEAISSISAHDEEEIRASLEKLRYHLFSIDKMEHISLGSIL